LRRAKELLRAAVERAATDHRMAPATLDDLAVWAESLRGHIGRDLASTS
jgi:hypothetical protein